VLSQVSRTRGGGETSYSVVASNVCGGKASCKATASMNYAFGSNDLWHGWGWGTVWYTEAQGGGRRDIPKTRSPECVSM
jgi:hypothetical protein